MAKLFFRYGTTNSSKSANLLMVAHNYREQWKEVILLTSATDDRYGMGRITSRVGKSLPAIPIHREENLFQVVQEEQAHFIQQGKNLHAVLIDEAQFFTRQHVKEMAEVVDALHIPVLAYGLKNDFSNRLFEGSQELLVQADKIEEIKTLCWHPECSRKATMTLRLDENNNAIREGKQIQTGGNETYVPVCRYHHNNPEGVKS